MATFNRWLLWTLLATSFKSGSFDPNVDLDCSRQIDLVGTGASQAATKIDALGHSYARYRNSQKKNVNFKFISMSSRFAMEQLMKNRTIDGNPLLFAVSSVRLSQEEKRQFPSLRMFPIMAWPMVIVFNIPKVRNLVLNVRHLPLIYMGNITYWDDPEIQQINLDTRLPHKKIIPVASAGESGDTRIITEAFSAFDESWKAKHGIFTNPEFSSGYCCNSTTWSSSVVHFFGKRTIGMTGLVASIPYTIGYLALAGIDELNLPTVSLQNFMGYRVSPSTDAVRAAVRYNKLKNQDSLDYSLSNAMAEDAYPIVAFNYFIFNVSTTPGVTCCQMEELAGFVEWMLESSVKFFESKGAAATFPESHRNLPMFQSSWRRYKRIKVAVTSHVADTVIRVILQEIQCNGQYPYARFKQSREMPAIISSWKLGLTVASVMVGIGLLSFILYLILRRRMNERSGTLQWLIDGSQIPNMREGGIISLQIKRTNEGSSGSSVSFKSLAGIKAEFDHSAAMLCELNVQAPQKWQSSTRKEVVRMLKTVNHHVVLQVMGLTTVDGTTYVLAEMPGKGTLRHTLRSSKFDLHADFKMALSTNLLNGLSYLHQKNITHGLLNSQTCYVDSSWCLKIGQWLDLTVYQRENPMALSDLIIGDIENMTDEELLRVFFIDPRAYHGVYDKASDIFALGLLVFEIFTFNKDTSMRTPEMLEIVKKKMKKGTSELPVTTQEYPRSIEFLIRMCLGEPSSRPTIEVMQNEIKKLRTSTKGIVDMLMETMEAYAAKLETMVEERTMELTKKTNQLEDVTKKMEELLHEVLPPPVATKLLRGETVEPESFESATIYFSDIIGFSEICSQSTPSQVMGFLNDLWRMFDASLEKYDVYKVDTIGDAYMVCSGLPIPNGLNHAKEISLMSIDLLKSCQNFKFAHLPNQPLEIRIGINSGQVVTGVVGQKMPQYCVFGDAVNTASRMESTSQAMHIQVSQATHDILVRHFPQFRLTYRGSVEVKGKGSMETYWMEPEVKTNYT